MRKQASREIHCDTDPLFTGTHSGPDSSVTLIDRGACFRSLGADPTLGLYVENETQETNGYVVAADEDTVTVNAAMDGTGAAITWDSDDTYSIYATSVKAGFVSAVWTDVSRGWKINERDDITADGWRREDVDIDDRGRKTVFGPGQPERY